MIVGLVDLIFGDFKDATVVYGIVLVNGLIGFYQKLKALSSIEALKNLKAFRVKVIRVGKEMEIDIEDLVPVDMLALDEKDKDFP